MWPTSLSKNRTKCGFLRRPIGERPPSRPDPKRPASRLDAHPLERHVVVGHLRERHLLADTPGQRLLVQRQVADVVSVELEGFLDQFAALGLVGLGLDLLGEFVELRIAVGTQVELAGALLVRTGRERAQRVVRFLGGRGPAKIVEACVAALYVG